MHTEFNGSANKALDPCTEYKVSRCSQHTLPSNNHQKRQKFTGQGLQEKNLKIQKIQNEITLIKNNALIVLYSIVHRVFNACCPVGSKAKITWPQLSEKKRRGGAVERDPRRFLASTAGTDRKRLRYLPLYTSSVSFPIRLKTRRGSWSSKSTGVLVNLLTAGSATHTYHNAQKDRRAEGVMSKS